MYKNNNQNIFFQTNEFETMLLQVANDDAVSFKNNNKGVWNEVDVCTSTGSATIFRPLQQAKGPSFRVLKG